MLETVPMDRELRPSLLFYCQHSLGIGHLTRSFALADALRERFCVTFLNGGRLPPGVRVPPQVRIVDLPPLGMDDGHTVVSRDVGVSVDAARARRKALILEAVAQVQPDVLLVELFPFGRKKFADEILPMIRAVRAKRPRRGVVVCSLRDILVDVRPDQRHHDDRARGLVDRYFDAVLVHADPSFARLESSFRPSRPMRTPVAHTGFVVPSDEGAAVPRGSHLLVSAGGGIVGEPLFRAVLDAVDAMTNPPPLRMVAGPFLPEPQWRLLQRRVASRPHVQLVRHVDDMVAQMRAARASISQCGYNTAMDLVRAQVPALVVPYETPTENEQRTRAERLAALGAMQVVRSADITPAAMAGAIEALLAFKPTMAALETDGAQRSVQQIEALLVNHLNLSTKHVGPTASALHQEVACRTQ